MNASRGRYLSELRRSNAAGIHNSKPTRTVLKKSAIKEELDMSILDQDYLDAIEPTDEELRAIELDEEEYVPDDEDDILVDLEDEYDYDGYNSGNYLEY